MRILGWKIEREPRQSDPVFEGIPVSTGPEQRSVKLGDQGWENISGTTTKSGMRISEEKSMRIIAVYACVRVISESIASLPFKVYRSEGRARHPEPSHPLYEILQSRSNDIMNAMTYRELILVHLCLWGNHYSEIERNGAGEIVALWPIEPWRVTPRIVNNRGRVMVKFDVMMKSGEFRTFDSSKIFHVPGLGFNGVVGKSVIQLHRETLGLEMAAQTFASKFFKNDTRMGTYFTTDETLGEEQYDRLKKEYDSWSGEKEAWKPKILEGGLKAGTVAIPMKDTQFIETRKYSRVEIAAMFRVQPHKIMDLERATFSNIEQQNIEFVTDTLRPWLVRIEKAATAQLLTEVERPRVFVAHVVDGLLRGDQKARYDSYAIGRNWGWLSANDILELENRNPIDGGNVYLQPLNMVPAGTDSMAAADEDVNFDDTDENADRSKRSRPEIRNLPNRYGTARALETVYLDKLKRAIKRETSDIRKKIALLRDGSPADFTQWLVDFERGHAEWLGSRVLPMFRSMGEAMIEAARSELGDEELGFDSIEVFVEEYTAAFTRRYTGSSRGQLLKIVDEAEDHEAAADLVEGRLDEWDESRAAKDARRERQRSSNAFTKAAWAVAGVATVTWQNVGSENCPICEDMDGRTSSISQSFVGPGDDVADLTVQSNIAHPPIHDGCDCILTPGLSPRSAPSPGELRSILDSILESHSAPDHSHRTEHEHG